jgi:phosphoglycolate phosphatase
MRAIVSNKPDVAVQDLAAEYFPGMFNAVVGERAGIRRKPAPDTVDAVIERLGLSREETVYVGDSEVDIETAKNAGIDCVCVSWGFRSEEQLRESGAERIAADAEKLAEELLFY